MSSNMLRIQFERFKLWYNVDDIKNHRFRSRSFFSTRDGRLGRGPPSLKPGDTVCCFHGAAPLFVLRFSDEGNGVAQFVGDAFVHGCMDFDSLEAPQKNYPEGFSLE